MIKTLRAIARFCWIGAVAAGAMLPRGAVGQNTDPLSGGEPDRSVVLSLLPGVWTAGRGPQSCTDASLAISLAPDSATITIAPLSRPAPDPRFGESTSIYPIVGWGENSVRAMIEEAGELNSGVALHWDFELTLRDQFCLRRADAPAGVCGTSFRRCVALASAPAGPRPPRAFGEFELADSVHSLEPALGRIYTFTGLRQRVDLFVYPIPAEYQDLDEPSRFDAGVADYLIFLDEGVKSGTYERSEVELIEPLEISTAWGVQPSRLIATRLEYGGESYVLYAQLLMKDGWFLRTRYAVPGEYRAGSPVPEPPLRLLGAVPE